jgi:hypothetical protein
MGPEAKLWKTLKPLLEAEKCLCTRIENRHGGGIPDIDVSSPVGAFKIELKVSQKFSVGLSDMQIAYNTLLTHKNGLSFILAEVQAPPKPPSVITIFGDQGPRTSDRGPSGAVCDHKSSGRGPSGRVCDHKSSGRVGDDRDRYYLWHGRDAVEVGRSGLRAQALESGPSLLALVARMLAVSHDHHAALLAAWGKGPKA